MDRRVEEVCFLRRLASSQSRTRWILSPSKAVSKPEDSVLHLRKDRLQQYSMLLRTMLPPRCHAASCSHMLVRRRLPVSDQNPQNRTLRRLAIFQDNLQPAADRAGTTVLMEYILVKVSEIRPSHVPISAQALEDQTCSPALKPPIMAGP